MHGDEVFRVAFRPAVVTRHDARNPCANCGHTEFVVIERGRRDAVGTKLEVDVERCEACGVGRHS